MAVLKPDQLEIDADGATARPPGTRVIPEPGRYDIDTTCSAVTQLTAGLPGLNNHCSLPEVGNVSPSTRVPAG